MAIEPTRKETSVQDIQESARQIKETRETLEKEPTEQRIPNFLKRPFRYRETEILRGLYEKEGLQFPPADTKNLDHDRELAKEARRLYELEMTEADRKKEREQIAAWATELSNLSTGALNWINFLQSRELWQMLRNETQKEIVFRSYNSISADMEILALQLVDLLQYYPDLEEYYKRNGLIDYFSHARNGLMFGIELLPFYIEEYSKPIYGGKCPADLWEEAEKGAFDQPVDDSLYMQAEKAALAAHSKAFSIEPRETIEKFTAAPVTTFLTPTDILNRLSFTQTTAGSFRTDYPIAKKGKGKTKKELKIVYSVDFSALDDATSRKLNAFDKRVVFAVAACMDAGNEIISYSQLYRAMGGKSSISASQITAIDKSLNLLAATRVIYKLAEEKGFSYKGINIDAACIEFERIKKVEINGAIVEGAIKPLRYPPAATLAKELNQITTNNIKLLQDIPLNITQETCAITDYIFAHIAMINNKGVGFSSFLLDTICKETGINNPRQKLRAIDKITKVLESCQKFKKIKSFSYDKDKKKFSITY